jgi:hypothetical protein
MDKTGLRANVLSEMSKEGDDIVFGFSQMTFAARLGIAPISASPDAACASISNHMRKRVSGDQIDVISGRL